MLSKAEFEIVLAVLEHRRKRSKASNASESDNENDLRDVLTALKDAGLIVVNRGAVLALQKVIDELLHGH